MKDNIIAGLDIGSTEVRLVVGQRVRPKDEAGEILQIIGATSVPSEGINKGVVTSIEEATSSISACLEKAERLVGVPLSNVWVSVNDPYVKCDRSKGVVAVSKSDGEISPDDVSRAMESAKAFSMPPNYDILHTFPIRFSVDNQEDIKDPIGMSGVRLGVETLIVQGLTTQIKNLTKAVYRTGLDINDLVLSPLCGAEAVLTSKQRDLGVAVINIGASITSLAVYEEGELIHVSFLPVGSEHITSDIAIGLRCPINLAERIKIEYGTANPSLYSESDELIDINDLAKEEELNEEMEKISGRYVAEIIEARVEEIFEKIDAELKKIDRSGMLPAGVFLIGGGAKLNGLADLAKKKLRLPASVGVPRNVNSVIDKVSSPDFLTALGLVVWSNKFANSSKNSGGPKFSGTAAAGKVVDKVKKMFSSLMP